MKGKYLNLKSKILAGLGVLALGVTLAGPAYASVSPEIPLTTTVHDIAYDGQGGYLHIPSSAGGRVTFTGSASDVSYQSIGSSLYWIRSSASGECLTESTTSPGEFFAEPCVTPVVAQQEWTNLARGADSEYKDLNYGSGQFITDPTLGSGTYNATTGLNGSWGPVGSTLLQG